MARNLNRLAVYIQSIHSSTLDDSKSGKLCLLSVHTDQRSAGKHFMGLWLMFSQAILDTLADKECPCNRLSKNDLEFEKQLATADPLKIYFDKISLV